jgi:hypothetical protein
LTHQLRRRNVSTAIEKRILTALIVSTQFNREVVHLINTDYFTNSFIRTVARWCIDFYITYDIAPFDHIQDIFIDRQVELKEEDIDLIQRLLTDISKRYELDSGINLDYSVTQALKFFKTRELMITSSNIKVLIEQNNIAGAEAQINEFTKISRLTSGWVDPLEEKYVDEVFQRQDRMFKFPGQLGYFLGGFDREWLIAIAAGYKKGKSYALQEIVMTAIHQNLKVAFFSLEMGRAESNNRFYKRIMGAGTSDGGPAIYPCFDCTYNQNNSCKRSERVNRLPLLTRNGKPEFLPDIKYKPCTLCRTAEPRSYSVAWWYEIVNRPAYTAEAVKIHLRSLKKVWNNLYRFKQYPKFSATLDDMRRDLDILENTEGFIPDIIIIDQANGIKPESGISLEGTAPHMAAWRGMASMTGERNAMVVSPTQITRAALDKKSVGQSDIALHIGLLGDIDVGYSLGQTPVEKKEGIIRYTKLMSRHEELEVEGSCIVLQKLGFGQANLDAQILYTG